MNDLKETKIETLKRECRYLDANEVIDYLFKTNRLVLQDATQDRADALKMLDRALDENDHEIYYGDVIGVQSETIRAALAAPSIDSKVVEQAVDILKNCSLYGSYDPISEVIGLLVPLRKSRED